MSNLDPHTPILSWEEVYILMFNNFQKEGKKPNDYQLGIYPLIPWFSIFLK